MSFQSRACLAAKHVQKVGKLKIQYNLYDYNLLTHYPRVIILVPKDLSLQELFNGILSFDTGSILAEI